jgi:predicted CoA-binding protein
MRKRVAVIGASRDRAKYGNKAFRAYLHQGHEAIPVNPAVAEVEGHRAYASILDIPGDVDMATFYVPPRIGLKVLDEVARKGVRELWLNPGSESPAVMARARELGLEPVLACSIMAIGESPGAY